MTRAELIELIEKNKALSDKSIEKIRRHSAEFDKRIKEILSSL